MKINTKKMYFIIIALLILLIYPVPILANSDEPNISSQAVVLIKQIKYYITKMKMKKCILQVLPKY